MRERAIVWLAAASLALGVGFLAGATAVGAFERWAGFPDPMGRDMDHDHGHGGGIVLTDAGRRVASGLKCPCGCPDLLLACDCARSGGAAEVKQVIMMQLNSGRSEAEARIELVNRYGAKIQRAGR